ncbi:MAG: DNA polymerase III subunit delta, partial [Anaerolineales bacterium]|nr:DNA polymerase III subunit delta [Anaerolineales bacterium]
MGDPSLAALNTTLIDGRTAALAEVRAACDALPFLAARRLVLVEGWLTRLLARVEPAEDDEGGEEPRRSGGGGTARETMAALVEYLPHLPESTALVLVEPRDLPERNVVLKTAGGAGWAFVKRFDLPRGEALVRWIRARAKAAGGELTREAAQGLADVEADPRALGNEIVKLINYVGLERPVELDDVQALTPAGSEAKIFDLVDLIGQRRGPQAMRELHKLLETADPLYVLTMIVRQYRLMLQAKELLGERAAEADVSRALGLHPFPTGKICAQARNFSLDGLERIYHRLLDYDVSIKTGQMDAAAALDSLVGALTA